MKIRRLKDNSTLISVRSQANRDLGIFLAFTSSLSAMPVYYIILWFQGYRIKFLRDLLPAVDFALPIVLIGLCLIYFSRRRFLVARDFIRISDGLFRRPLTYRWEGEIGIRLTSLEEMQKGKPAVVWQLYLASGKYKYLLDARPEQIEIRGVAEAIANALKCPITEKTESGEELELQAEDLDLPYAERVKKYPHLLPRDVPRPARSNITRIEANGALVFTWNFCTTRCIVEVLLTGIFFLVISLVPLKPGSLSLYEFSSRNRDFFFYYALGTLMLIVILWLIGYKASIRIGNGRIAFLQSYVGLPFSGRAIPTAILEEVRASWGMRGPALQLISDEKILTLRIADIEDAMWLSQEIKRQLIKSGA